MAKLSDLAPNPRNPRRISPKKLALLRKSIQEFGSLDGVIYNVRTQRLVGAHQRQKIDPSAPIRITQNYDPPTQTGTVAEGFCLIADERFPYREVDWDEKKEMAANIAANKGAGDWDFPELSNWLAELDDGAFDLDLTLFDDLERESIATFSSVSPPKAQATSPIEQLKSHPSSHRNYPADQVQAMVDLIKESGITQNVVVAKDGTVLEGQLIVEASKKLGIEDIPIKQLDYDKNDTKALKILVNDNQLDHLAEKDDRVLSETLKFIKENDPTGLTGTGYNDQMLANLAFVTRPSSEIKDTDEAAEWAGMPEFSEADKLYKIIVSFEEEAKREEFMKLIGSTVVNRKQGLVWSIYWPEKERQDLSSLNYLETETDVDE